MKFNDTFLEIIKTDLEVGIVPALIGEPGIGKSSLIKDLATKMHTKSFTLPCNQLADKADLTGGRLVPYEHNGETKYKQEFYPHQVIMDAIDYANDHKREDPVLLLDEVNRSTSDVTSAALSIPTDRRIGSIDLPENLKVIVAGNDKGNVTSLDEASISRFAIYHVEPDAPTLISHLGDSLNPWVKAVLVKHPELIFEKGKPTTILVDGTGDDDDDNTASYTDLLDSGDEMLQLTTPRTIDAISRWLNATSTDKLTEYLQAPTIVGGITTTVLNETIEAKIGRTAFTTHLVAEIATGLTSGAVHQSNTLTANKPACYQDLKNVSTVNELEKVIAGLGDRDKSGSLLYALYERHDNTLIIQQLAAQTDALIKEDNSLLVQLAASDLLDRGNVETLLGTSTKIGASSQIVLSAVLPD
ncbi:AAA family ATPase [Microbacterium sp. SL62]|uniref:AAA family ATPase n=1 Tax=Microbacterium sp. SL62 TaxID=2995139 RepID=UPI00227687D2|nr:AAA family ATPase [Microbacterium sp. SL62]MCY1718527.1 AAA family ATPase [Microbacterium sp. SL62]